MRHLGTKLAIGAISVGVLTAVPAATAFASGAPGTASAFATAVITPAGGSISGFGIQDSSHRDAYNRLTRKYPPLRDLVVLESM